ncbi:hypothetical protein OG946_31340 [Streptomyces sp. NBC_01808]|uniref:hypothetical protein n=1 Tax=Streptomyces sp. NBC_01808 TaxID=2975947 RepID=UPI002DDC5635|nr:hypothetical protein [Streptomyces sp. NBC_01808]WSA41486.1 hypothetical protein OG946_31340 [Streptomyces sp. NBC_01808]
MATRRTRTLIAPAALLAVVLTACGGGPDEATGRDEARTPPSRSAASPEAVCVRLITYWAHDQLGPGGGSQSDYQGKGLSDGQNTILLDIVEEAAKERRANGAAAARRLVDSEVRKRCAERYDEGNAGAPSAGWPQ